MKNGVWIAQAAADRGSSNPENHDKSKTNDLATNALHTYLV